MQNKAYSEFFTLVKSLAGVSDFTSLEDSRIVVFMNRRLYMAYNASQSWNRFMVIGEERTLTDHSVPYSQASLTTIGEFIRIHRNRPFYDNTAIEYEFYVDSNGANILNRIDSTTTSVFVTYKKQWQDYTNVSTDIPLEFFHYAAHGSYADFLRMDGQLDKAMAEEQIAQSYLDIELSKAEQQRTSNIINRRITTHLSRQSR
jgi:hypothetical protein